MLGGCSSDAQRSKSLTLPSGRTVRVLGVGRMNFTAGDPALMLKYETDLRIQDKTALRTEVDDIWSVFRNDVEKGKFKAAIISANEVPQGLIAKKSAGYNFVDQKRPDGRWHCLDDK